MATAAVPGHKPRLILVDDHAMVLEGFRMSLADDYAIVGVAQHGHEVLELLRQRPADCLLLDISMPGTNGLDLIPTIRRLQPDLRIIMVTMLVDRCLADAAIGAGARGFVPKDAPLSELRTAIAEVLEGRRYVSPRVPKTTHRASLGAAHVGLNRLTPRQQQIVLLLGEGKSSVEVARLLHLGPSTITFHRKNIMRILGLDSEGSLLRFAVLVRAGAIDANVVPT